MNSTVANTIWEQLGGKRMCFMTGAKVEDITENSIRFKLGLGKLTAFEVLYDAGADTYTVNLFVGNGMKRRLARDPIHDVYAEDLVPMFERETGLVTSL